MNHFLGHDDIVSISPGPILLVITFNEQQTISVYFLKPQRPVESASLLPSITSRNLDGHSSIFLHTPKLPASSLQLLSSA